MPNAVERLPQHLKKYIVRQDYSKYTALDHAVWRYILRQLKNYLSAHAHKSYLDGLEKTGIEIEYIPKIEDISARLEKFGWRALPVSGFIPPAAFMELQSLSILPIASDMRSIDHLLYTPAPDIVHEAAGHAPIIADPEYAEYLKQYAQVAKKAIISKEDLDQYKAIRELSDIKENPASTESEISAAEEKLQQVTADMSFVSEASELSRMNWWTAEYGLIGDINSPKIFGAGLLSSVGESQWCLSEKVKRIPLSIECIRQSYDITEPQPQLFVAKNFKHLSSVLAELAETMSYKVGGKKALDRAVQAESVNSVEFENKLQISGILKKYSVDKNSQPAYLQFSGPTQLSYDGKEITGHDKNYHVHGYGTPIGRILNFSLAVLKLHSPMNLIYDSGVKISGELTQINNVSENAVILTFKNARCEFNGEILFQPEWGLYDIILADKVTSVFGGPADRSAYGETDDFVAARVGLPVYSEQQKQIFASYQQIRDLRKQRVTTAAQVEELLQKYLNQHADEWLLFVELLELAVKSDLQKSLQQQIESHLSQIGAQNHAVLAQITEGIRLAHAKY